MSDTATPPPARYANGRFGPGNPGRPPGARGRASHKVVLSILEDFEAHKQELLSLLRAQRSESYFAALLRFLPQVVSDEPPAAAELSDAEARAVITRARVVLGGGLDPREAVAELEALLAGEQP